MSDPGALKVVVFTPVRRDAELLIALLQDSGHEVRDCTDPAEMEECFGEDAIALFTTEEAMRPKAIACIRNFVDAQPLWSDFPIVIFCGAEVSRRFTVGVERLGPRANVTLVDRPVRVKTLRSIIDVVTRARLRQHAMRDLFHRLEDRIAERDRFLAILGHELRNPLGAIVLAAQMADDDSGLDSQNARRIERQALHVSRLVDDLLDLSRITTGKIVLKKSSVDLNQIIEQSVRSLQNDRFRRELKLTLDLWQGPLRVEADPVRIEQVVSNLLTNAFKYTPEGGSVTVTTAEEEGSAVIRVADSGVGIAPGRIDSIFELFSQAENAIGRSQGGMGIGLHLVRSLVDLHGGMVQARSDGENRGSEFTVRLPLAPRVPLPVEAESSDAAPPAVFANHRIVVVDDNADIRDLLAIRLRKLGHEVETAADGRSGYQRILSNQPHAAIIDIGMPGLDGYELAKQVRSSLNDGIVLIALTGFGQSEDKERALAAGFDEHLTKPIRVEELQRILAHHLNDAAESLSR